MLRGVENVEHQISDLDYRIELVEKSKVEKLQGMLPGLKEAYDQVIQKLKGIIKESKTDLWSLKAFT